MWLLKDSNGRILILERKLKVLLNTNVKKVKETQKIPGEKRFTNKVKRPWTQDEIEKLKTYVLTNPTHTDEMIGNFLNRTAKAVHHQRKKLGIKRQTQTILKTANVPYSNEEIECIKEVLKNSPHRSAEMLKDLVNRLNDLSCNKGKI